MYSPSFRACQDECPAIPATHSAQAMSTCIYTARSYSTYLSPLETSVTLPAQGPISGDRRNKETDKKQTKAARNMDISFPGIFHPGSMTTFSALSEAKPCQQLQHLCLQSGCNSFPLNLREKGVGRTPPNVINSRLKAIF